MHRHLILLSLAATAVACGKPSHPGPDPVTLTIMETEPSEPAPPPPALAVAPPTAEDLWVLEPVAEAEPAEVEAPRATGIEVRSGENLVLLARWAGSSVEAIAELNGLDVSEPLFPGQGLLIPSGDLLADEALARAREDFSTERLNRYLERRGGLLAVEEHRVRTGETAWGIAHRQRGIPSWVLAAYNADSDLDHLSIGDTLRLPVLADTVADAELGEESAGGALEAEEELIVSVSLPAPAQTVSLGDEDELERLAESIELEEEAELQAMEGAE